LLLLLWICVRQRYAAGAAAATGAAILRLSTPEWHDSRLNAKARPCCPSAGVYCTWLLLLLCRVQGKYADCNSSLVKRLMQEFCVVNRVRSVHSSSARHDQLEDEQEQREFLRPVIKFVECLNVNLSESVVYVVKQDKVRGSMTGRLSIFQHQVQATSGQPLDTREMIRGAN
jgi:hypothetical protein